MATPAPGAVVPILGGAAATAAEKRKHDECVALDKSFVSAKATVEQKRHYVECVKKLYPKEGEGGDLGFAIIPALLFVLIFRVWLTRRARTRS